MTSGLVMRRVLRRMVHRCDPARPNADSFSLARQSGIRRGDSRTSTDKQTPPAWFRPMILYSPLATLQEHALTASRPAVTTFPERPPGGLPHAPNARRIAGDLYRADLLSAPYRGIVVAATNRIAPRPASNSNVELVTP
ncbi:hypothetical protein [Burkholderia sp. Bp9143]|uniref:hypothetical protein n=1 Tax=Burkholderia sp. Bp9143 TaxID=2184574 RepID=UPI000F5A7370|nr:hypothetical protein [Burkholderia sp. Bp9143]